MMTLDELNELRRRIDGARRKAGELTEHAAALAEAHKHREGVYGWMVEANRGYPPVYVPRTGILMEVLQALGPDITKTAAGIAAARSRALLAEADVLERQLTCQVALPAKSD